MLGTQHTACSEGKAAFSIQPGKNQNPLVPSDEQVSAHAHNSADTLWLPTHGAGGGAEGHLLHRAGGPGTVQLSEKDALVTKLILRLSKLLLSCHLRLFSFPWASSRWEKHSLIFAQAGLQGETWMDRDGTHSVLWFSWVSLNCFPGLFNR